MTRWRYAYERIRPRELPSYFREGGSISGTLADLLLENEATVIFHVDPKRTELLGKLKYAKPLILGANYHGGPDGGDFKIIVQNIPERGGPWVLFRPPGSDEKTFYLQDMTFPSFEPRFQEHVKDSPAKIKQWYLCRRDPLRIFEEFERKGFNFVNHAMTREHYDYLANLSYEVQPRLNFYNRQ